MSHSGLLLSLGVCALFFACGDSREEGSGKDECEKLADDYEDKAEECGILLEEDGGEPAECTADLAAQAKCFGPCISAASCEALNGEDADGASEYAECVIACLPEEEGGAPPVGGNGGSGGAGAGGPGGECVLDPECPNPDLNSCICNGCDPAGCYDPDADPPVASDCTCGVCAGDPSCGCDQDGVCDPFLEGCDCADCDAFC